eukprot:UN01327
MGSRLSLSVSNVLICGLVVSTCFSQKTLSAISKCSTHNGTIT